jgi:hypothetical protein
LEAKALVLDVTAIVLRKASHERRLLDKRGRRFFEAIRAVPV